MGIEQLLKRLGEPVVRKHAGSPQPWLRDSELRRTYLGYTNDILAKLAASTQRLRMGTMLAHQSV